MAFAMNSMYLFYTYTLMILHSIKWIFKVIHLHIQYCTLPVIQMCVGVYTLARGVKISSYFYGLYILDHILTQHLYVQFQFPDWIYEVGWLCSHLSCCSWSNWVGIWFSNWSITMAKIKWKWIRLTIDADHNSE
jgi:hypothetical protein